MGSPHPVRRVTSARRPARQALLTALGLLAAAGGAILGATPPEVTVTLDEHAYRLGDVALAAQGGGVYAGPAGAIVIARGPAGTRAGASTTLHGDAMLGSCRLDPDGMHERCTFDLGARTVTAIDEFDGSGWRRRYSDGLEVRIRLGQARPVPVPIAVGR